MSNVTHTPGPWFPINNDTYWEVRTENAQHAGEQIGDACSSKFIDGHDDNPVAIANVRLMAAAPDLLEACIEALENDEASEGFNAANMDKTLRTKLHNAIAKATGE